MRQNIFFLKEYAHKVYFQGLLDTGISFKRIPRIQEMNDTSEKLAGRGGGGRIHPAGGLMEFRAYKVLVIACDMRQIHHIEYTPAPDTCMKLSDTRRSLLIANIKLFAALRRSRCQGELPRRISSSTKIRHLSILKEQPNSDPKEVEEATKLVEHRQKNLGDPSEMALLSRLHWWTVEYGLIGSMENPKIYGAGLISSSANRFRASNRK